MSHSKTFALFSIAVLGVIFVAFRDNTRVDRPGNSVPITVVPPRPQPEPRVAILPVNEGATTRRLLREVVTRQRWAGPLLVRAAADGHVFVVDDGNDDRVTEYSPEGRRLRDIEGVDTKRFSSVSDLAVTDDALWIVDLLARKIHVENRISHEWKTFAQDVEPYRLLPLNTAGSELAIMRIGLDRWADFATPQGQIRKSFEHLLVDQSRMSLILDGYFVKRGDDIFYAGKYLGVLACFSATTGELKWIVDMVGHPDSPAIVSRGNETWVEHPALLASQSVTTAGDRVLMLSQRISGVQVKAFIDMYAASTGAYVSSLELPFDDRWTSISANATALYAAGDLGVMTWPIAVVADGASNSLPSAGRSFVQ